MHSTLDHYVKEWEALRREYDARADRLSAERRMEYNRAFDNFSEEISAMGDWTEAGWREMVAKIERKWQEFAIDRET